MRKCLLIIGFLLAGFQLQSQNLEGLSYGTDSTFEVLTWNIEWFAKNNEATVDYVSQIILSLDVDVIALQEIVDLVYFEMLLENLDGWEGYFVDSDWQELAYLYKTADIEDVEFFELFPQLGREFPREPLVMEMKFKGEDVIVINNHLKCCGDGILYSNDLWDEEKRRLDAMSELYNHINIFYPDSRVILLGDFNDILTDDPANNIFKDFLDDSERYLAVDMGIAEGSSWDWSYPTWPSHLDHIIISNELFADFSHDSSDISVIKIEEYLDEGWSEYDQNVTDHRPVAIKLFKSETTGLKNSVPELINMSNHPNPFGELTSISFNPVTEPGKLEIYNSSGTLVEVIFLDKGQSSVTWFAEKVKQGVYYGRLMLNEKLVGIRKMVVIE